MYSDSGERLKKLDQNDFILLSFPWFWVTGPERSLRAEGQNKPTTAVRENRRNADVTPDFDDVD